MKRTFANSQEESQLGAMQLSTEETSQILANQAAEMNSVNISLSQFPLIDPVMDAIHLMDLVQDPEPSASQNPPCPPAPKVKRKYRPRYLPRFHELFAPTRVEELAKIINVMSSVQAKPLQVIRANMFLLTELSEFFINHPNYREFEVFFSTLRRHIHDFEIECICAGHRE